MFYLRARYAQEHSTVHRLRTVSKNKNDLIWSLHLPKVWYMLGIAPSCPGVGWPDLQGRVWSVSRGYD